MATSTPGLSLEQLHTIAGGVHDPELPPLTLSDLGILRSVERLDGTVVVTVTPTYSGCPAVEYIEDEIRRVLQAAGCDDVRIERALSPAWTSDWITADGRTKLTEAGVAPPRAVVDGAPDGSVPVVLGRPVRGRPVLGRSVLGRPVLGRTGRPPLPCPRCGSVDTAEISPFGSTACKALHRCNACSEPFDYFKEI